MNGLVFSILLFRDDPERQFPYFPAFRIGVGLDAKGLPSNFSMLCISK